MGNKLRKAYGVTWTRVKGRMAWAIGSGKGNNQGLTLAQARVEAKRRNVKRNR